MVLSVLLAGTTARAQAPAPRQLQRVYWVDQGIDPTGFVRFLEMSNRVPAAPVTAPGIGSSPFGVPDHGRLSIEMPRHLLGGPLSRPDDDAWLAYEQALAQALAPRFTAAAQQGLTELEIQTVERINLAGYVTPWAQSAATRFHQAIHNVLFDLKHAEVASGRGFEVFQLDGSNGGHAATTAIPLQARRNRNVVDHIALLDARAKTADTIETIHVLGQQNVTLIPSTGDFWAGSMMANTAEAQEVQRAFPGVRLLRTDPPGANWNPFATHIKMMDPATGRGRVWERKPDGSETALGEVGIRDFWRDVVQKSGAGRPVPPPIPQIWHAPKDARAAAPELDLLAAQANGRQRVMIVGSGAQADRLAFLVGASRRPEDVIRVPAHPGSQLLAYDARAALADIVLGIEPTRAAGLREVPVPRTTALSIAGALGSLHSLGRTIEQMQARGDAITLGLDTLKLAAGDDPFVSAFGEIWERPLQVIERADQARQLMQAMNADLERSAAGDFVMLKSETFAALVDLFAGEFVPASLCAQQALAAARLAGTSGLWNVETVDNGLAALNSGLWYVVGLLATRNHEKAATVQALGDRARTLGQAATRGLFERWALRSDGVGNKVLADWRQANEVRVHHGLAPLTFESFSGSTDQAIRLARSAGVSTAMYETEYLTYSNRARARSQQAATLPKPIPPQVGRIDPPRPPRRFDDPPPYRSHPGLGGPGDRPPPPPPAAASPSLRLPARERDIGGILLAQAASVSGSTAELGQGSFDLLCANPDGEVDLLQLRRFVTALWAVYFSREGPGISIDPIAPGVDKHVVRYIGCVVNSDLGRVMREADYLMKKWAIGTETPDYPGFRSVDEIAGQLGRAHVGISRRFWFVPEDMQFAVDGPALLFRGGRIRLRTEPLAGGKAPPEDQVFADFFTEHYQAIAAQHPVFAELYEYAKLVSLAHWLKEHRVPLLWYLLINKDLVMTEDAKDVVDELVKPSVLFPGTEIRGGVDLADHAGQRRMTASRDEAAAGHASKSMPDAAVTAGASAATAGSGGGAAVQTDLALWVGGQPGLEISRFHAPSRRGGAFGRGWHLLLPFETAPVCGPRAEFGELSVPARWRLTNWPGGRTAELAFRTDARALPGYVPADLDGDPVLGLFLMTDGSVRLADRLGGEYQFDTEGRPTDLVFTDQHAVKVERCRVHAAASDWAAPPFRLQVSDADREIVRNAEVPRRLCLQAAVHKASEVLELARDNEFGVVGYLPVDRAASHTRFLALLSDGSFRLQLDDGTAIEFDAAGRFERMSQEVVHALRLGDQQAVFVYEHAGHGFRVRWVRATTGGVSPAMHVVGYEYDREGCLSRVSLPIGKDVEVTVGRPAQ